MDIGPVHLSRNPSFHCGTACETIEQLKRWFTEGEYKTLLRFGYFACSIKADRILGSSTIQCVFERKLPLSQNIQKVNLY
jgi:hypothetical protein